MNGEDSEFQKLYDEFYPKILRYITHLAGPAEAEDLTQEVFIKVSSALKSFRRDSQLSTWIYRIATNTAIDRLRSNSSKKLLQIKIPSHIIGAADRNSWSTEAHPVEASYVRKEMNDCIRNFIESLPESFRTVLILSEFEELKNNEIAEILGISLDAVKIRLHRARSNLKKELETNCNFEKDEKNELTCDLKGALKNYSAQN